MSFFDIENLGLWCRQMILKLLDLDFEIEYNNENECIKYTELFVAVFLAQCSLKFHQRCSTFTMAAIIGCIAYFR